MFSGKGETPDKALGRVSKTHYGEQKMGLNTCMAWKLERLLLEEGFGSTGPTKMQTLYVYCPKDLLWVKNMLLKHHAITTPWFLSRSSLSLSRLGCFQMKLNGKRQK